MYENSERDNGGKISHHATNDGLKLNFSTRSASIIGCPIRCAPRTTLLCFVWQRLRPLFARLRPLCRVARARPRRPLSGRLRPSDTSTAVFSRGYDNNGNTTQWRRRRARVSVGPFSVGRSEVNYNNNNNSSSISAPVSARYGKRAGKK